MKLSRHPKRSWRRAKPSGSTRRGGENHWVSEIMLWPDEVGGAKLTWSEVTPRRKYLRDHEMYLSRGDMDVLRLCMKEET
jgi:hypothetical protein